MITVSQIKDVLNLDSGKVETVLSLKNSAGMVVEVAIDPAIGRSVIKLYESDAGGHAPVPPPQVQLTAPPPQAVRVQDPIAVALGIDGMEERSAVPTQPSSPVERWQTHALDPFQGMGIKESADDDGLPDYVPGELS